MADTNTKELSKSTSKTMLQQSRLPIFETRITNADILMNRLSNEQIKHKTPELFKCKCQSHMKQLSAQI